MALDRQYYSWDDPFPTPGDVWSARLGRSLVISWKTSLRDGSVVLWKDIAAGEYDEIIDRRARRLAVLPGTVYFVFDHEPRVRHRGPMPGSAKYFASAWRHVHDRFRMAGARNVVFVLTWAASAYRNGSVSRYWPGSKYVDALAADGFNWYGCNSRKHAKGKWTSFREIFEGFYEYGLSRGKPMMILEWGTGEDHLRPMRKAEWISDAAETLKTWPEIFGVSYFHSGRNRSCQRWVNTSPQSLDAFRSMGADEYFNPESTQTLGGALALDRS
jgi:hypothetical protein